MDVSGAAISEQTSGDHGDEVANLGYASPDFPASPPWVTSVGGTSVAIDKKGAIPPALASGKRVSPDVSALADPYTGFLIGLRPIVDDDTLAVGDYVNETYGGTSLASPIVAAQIAIVQQATRTTIGFANPTLYAVKRVLPNSFRDVLPQNPTQAVAYTSKTSGNSYLVSFDQDTTLSTAAGYDPVTGLGDVSFDLLSLVAHGRH